MINANEQRSVMNNLPNIVFLDEYSICGCNLTAIRKFGNYTGYDFTYPGQVVTRCADADIIITNKVVLDAATIRQLPRLRLICVAATGMNNVDLETAGECNIVVRNAAGYSTHSVAETTLSSALALLRQIGYYDRYVKSGEYAASDRPFHFGYPTRQLYGKHWGIIGLGNIGREVARLAEAFGCEVNYASVSGVARQEAWSIRPLDELLSWADVISIHCPLNERTRNLITAEKLALMKPTALLVNVARGGIVDEAALAEALDNDRLGGAAFDVYDGEPIAADNPLLAVKQAHKLLLSPHNAWSSLEAIDTLIGCIAQNIERFLMSNS